MRGKEMDTILEDPNYHRYDNENGQYTWGFWPKYPFRTTTRYVLDKGLKSKYIAYPFRTPNNVGYLYELFLPDLKY